MRKIPLGKNGHVIICDCHYDEIVSSKWYFDGRYAKRDILQNGKRIGREYMHRAILRVDAGMLVDHINRNKLDNRCSNLRQVTLSQNAINSTKSNKTGYRGVQYQPKGVTKKWRAYIGGNSRSIGVYHTKQEAAKAYNAEAIKLYGEYAKLNDV